MAKKLITYSLFSLTFALVFMNFAPVFAETEDAFRSTPYPLPRFVSLNSDKIFVRTGPGQRYPIKWIFKKKGLPAEVILEYEVWRKIKDYEGEVGWVHQSLISGRRMGLIQGEDLVSVYKKPDSSSRLIAYLEAGVVGSLQACEGEWCHFEASGYKGWVHKQHIWGVYSKESFN